MSLSKLCDTYAQLSIRPSTQTQRIGPKRGAAGMSSSSDKSSLLDMPLDAVIVAMMQLVKETQGLDVLTQETVLIYGTVFVLRLFDHKGIADDVWSMETPDEQYELIQSFKDVSRFPIAVRQRI